MVEKARRRQIITMSDDLTMTVEFRYGKSNRFAALRFRYSPGQEVYWSDIACVAGTRVTKVPTSEFLKPDNGAKMYARIWKTVYDAYKKHCRVDGKIGLAKEAELPEEVDA